MKNLFDVLRCEDNKPKQKNRKNVLLFHNFKTSPASHQAAFEEWEEETFRMKKHNLDITFTLLAFSYDSTVAKTSGELLAEHLSMATSQVSFLLRKSVDNSMY